MYTDEMPGLAAGVRNDSVQGQGSALVARPSRGL